MKTGLRRYANRQRINFSRRAVNPARFMLDSARIAFGGSDATGNILTRPIRAVLVSDADASTSEEQLNPFFWYRSELRTKMRLISIHLLLKDVLRAPKLILSPFDIVILKMSFRTRPQEALRIVQTIRGAVNDKRIIYFDGDDDLCIQWPAIFPYIDLYVKKHLFRDRTQYVNRFVGKTNLTDFVHHHFGYSFSDDPVAAESGPVPMEHLVKLCVGVNLAGDRKIMSLYSNTQVTFITGARENDVVFRGNVPKPSDWMYYLRKDIEPALKRLQKSCRVIAPKARVSADEYYEEMLKSKICISPFGYGEICWRDFEGIICGCLVIKPDMGHVETNPDIFTPYQTYVPVRWDYSDLEEKCAYYLAHEDERERIVVNAFNVLDEFYKNCVFMSSFNKLLQRLSFNPVLTE